MKTIRIISGVFGHQTDGRIKPVKAGDPPIEVEAKVAERLVDQGFAIYLGDEPVATHSEGSNGDGEVNDPPAGENPPKGENDGDSGNKPPFRPEYNADMKLDDLKEIMVDCGMSFRVGMSKEDIVGMLDEYFEEIEEDGEGFPDLGGQGVVP